MITAWRIVKKRHAATAFSGEGARRYGGRWNGRGTPVVYVSETKALCLLEILVGIRSVQPMGAYVVIRTAFDEAIVDGVDLDDLPGDWRQNPPPPSTQRIGDRWVAAGSSAVLRVPSVIIPSEFNFILNPAHPDFNRIEVGEPQQLITDSRLGISSLA